LGVKLFSFLVREGCVGGARGGMGFIGFEEDKRAPLLVAAASMSDGRPRKTAAHGVANWILPVPQFGILEFAKSGGKESVVARKCL